MAVKKVGILTAGGLAPCLSSAIGGLIERYTKTAPEVEIICYRAGYKGLLLGDSFVVNQEVRDKAGVLHKHGGSPIGNSRVKLTNMADCVKRGLVKEGEDPLQVAAERLKNDGVDVLHTIGGDDTNTAAADLAAFLRKNGYELTVVGLPKTVDNDVIPIQQSLGAWTAAEQGARFFPQRRRRAQRKPTHVDRARGDGSQLRLADRCNGGEIPQYAGSDWTSCPRPGSAASARKSMASISPKCTSTSSRKLQRLRAVMDEIDCVNIFISEGAGVETIVKEMESRGEEVPKDAFGHYKLDAVNPGQWFGKQFASMLGAEKTLVQKSGYFSRAAPANDEDLALIARCVDKAVECALRGESGVVGEDEDRGGELRVIEFDRIRGGKPFDIDVPWFGELLASIDQPKCAMLPQAH